jgi:hypothetical protein
MEFAWRNLGKPRRTSVRIAGLWAEIMNPEPPEYAAEVLTTGPQRSIFPMNTGRMTKWRIRNS